MAYNRNRSGYRKNNNQSRKRKTKYTQAEQTAFRIGQQARVMESIDKNKNSRVYEAYCKGYDGVKPREKDKPLF